MNGNLAESQGEVITTNPETSFLPFYAQTQVPEKCGCLGVGAGPFIQGKQACSIFDPGP